MAVACFLILGLAFAEARVGEVLECQCQLVDLLAELTSVHIREALELQFKLRHVEILHRLYQHRTALSRDLIYT